MYLCTISGDAHFVSFVLQDMSNHLQPMRLVFPYRILICLRISIAVITSPEI